MKIMKKIIAISLATIIAVSSTTVPVNATSSSSESATLKIDVYMDRSFVSMNGTLTAWTTRLDELTTNIYGFFGGAFGIGVTFNFTPDTTRIISSPADDCIGTDYPASAGVCSCHTVAKCANSSTYPCTNYYRMRSNTLEAKSTTSAELLLTGHYPCGYSNNKHIQARGLSWDSYDQMICMDYDVDDGEDDDIDYYYARTTIVHEIGHLYGVKDHYGNGTPTGENDNCIWGDNRRSYEISSKMSICATCYNTIRANRTRYQH